MRFEKPKKKSGRPDFAAGRIAELQRQLATETNETRESELQQEINERQRSRPQPRRDAGKFER
jgi:phosphoglycerate-specific signal transduction histidine kinase